MACDRCGCGYGADGQCLCPSAAPALAALALAVGLGVLEARRGSRAKHQGGGVVVLESELMGPVMMDAQEYPVMLQQARRVKARLQAAGKRQGYVGGDVGGEFTVDEAAVLQAEGEVEVFDPNMGVDMLVVMW
jgi:hypothetical protein